MPERSRSRLCRGISDFKHASRSPVAWDWRVQLVAQACNPRSSHLQSMALSSMPRPKLPWCELCMGRERWNTGRMWMCAQNSPHLVRYLITSAQQEQPAESVCG